MRAKKGSELSVSVFVDCIVKSLFFSYFHSFCTIVVRWMLGGWRWSNVLLCICWFLSYCPWPCEYTSNSVCKANF